MGTVTISKTYQPGEKPTDANLNKLFSDLYNSHNGNIDNDNVSASAAIRASKIADAFWVRIHPSQLQPTATGAPANGTVTLADAGILGPGGGEINLILDTKDFDQSTAEHAFCDFATPNNFAAGGSTSVRVRIVWFAGTTGTNAVLWSVCFKALADGTLPQLAAADWTDGTADAAQNSTEEPLITTIDYTITLAAATNYLFGIARRANQASDTLAADAKLALVTIECVE